MMAKPGTRDGDELDALGIFVDAHKGKLFPTIDHNYRF